MSYTYLQAAGEESSAECFSDIPVYALSKSTNIAGACYSNGNAMESCHDSQSGMMSEPSMENRGLESCKLSAGASRAKTSQPQETAKESKASEADSGEKWRESLAKYDRDSCSWRTRQLSLFGGLGESLETWPEWGMMRDGECWAAPIPAGLTTGKESGYWPTLKCVDANMGAVQSRVELLKAGKWSHDGGGISRLTDYLAAFFDLPAMTKLHPDFTDWWMGWPMGWSDDTPLEMDKFQSWLQAHGKCCTLN